MSSQRKVPTIKLLIDDGHNLRWRKLLVEWLLCVVVAAVVVVARPAVERRPVGPQVTWRKRLLRVVVEVVRVRVVAVAETSLLLLLLLRLVVMVVVKVAALRVVNYR